MIQIKPNPTNSKFTHPYNKILTFDISVPQLVSMHRTNKPAIRWIEGWAHWSHSYGPMIPLYGLPRMAFGPVSTLNAEIKKNIKIIVCYWQKLLITIFFFKYRYDTIWVHLFKINEVNYIHMYIYDSDKNLSKCN